MTELALRPRSATEIIDLAVRLLRRHFGAFFTIGLVGAVPILVVQLLFLALGWSDPARLPVTIAAGLTGVGLVSFVVAIVFRSLMLGALLVWRTARCAGAGPTWGARFSGARAAWAP